MTQIAVPFALVFVTVRPRVDAKTLCFVVLPLSDVRVSLHALPDTIALFDAFKPLAVVHLSICPRVNTLSVRLACLILPLVVVAVRKQLVAAPVSLVVVPLALVNAPVLLVHENSVTLSLLRPRVQLASEDGVSILLHAERFGLTDRLIIELVADHLVLFYRVAVVFKLSRLARWPKPLIRHLLLNLQKPFFHCQSAELACKSLA